MKSEANGDYLLEMLRSRRTVRRYKDEAIPDTIVENILEAGRWAPSAHNLQPWKFVVIKKDAVIKDIQNLMRKKQKEMFAGFNIVMEETAKSLDVCRLLIAVYSNKAVTKKFDKLGEPYSSIGNLYEIQSVSFAVYGMMLYAHAAGLGSACLGISVFCEKEINALLGEDGVLMALLSIGVPSANAQQAKRKKVEEISDFI